MRASYQAVEPVPDQAPLLRSCEAPHKPKGGLRRYHGVFMAFVMSVMLAACVVAFASVKAKRPSSKSLKGTHPALLMAKYEYPSAQEHLTKRERDLDGAEDGDDDVCQTSIPISNINAFKTQTECDDCCSEACTDYLSSYGEYLWTCGSSYTSSQCDYSYDTFTIYKTRLCYACCENDCTRYLGGNALETYYFC